MNATVRKLAIPDTTEFSSLLNTVDLVTRAKLMHQLQVVVFPSGIGAKRYYFCMDGVFSIGMY